MRYVDAGFRPFDKQFIIVPMKESLRDLVSDYPDGKNADALLTFGYVDHEGGFILALLAMAKREKNIYRFSDMAEKFRSIPIREVMEDELEILGAEYRMLLETYKGHIVEIDGFMGAPRANRARSYKGLDWKRHPERVDEIKAILFRVDEDPEECWIRVENNGMQVIYGTLLEEPKGCFGYHQGDLVEVYCDKQPDGNILPIADVDGTMEWELKEEVPNEFLERSISEYREDQNVNTLYFMLFALGMSYVYLLYMDEAYLHPECITSDGKKLVPVFTSEKQIGEYGEGYVIMKKPFMHVLELAEEIGDIEGITVNPFTKEYILPKGMFSELDTLKWDHPEEGIGAL